MRIFLICLVLLLAACASEPPARIAPLRLAADNANRTAVAAANLQRWENAVDAWREALLAYQSMDDWAGQGRARLGLAQAYARLNQIPAAISMLVDMPEQSLFPAGLRAQAAYQLALLALPGNAALAQTRLDSAIQLCGKDCALTSQFANLAGRLAALRADWVAVQQHAGRALSSAQQLPAERAHANRLLAEAALAQAAPQQAKVRIDAALVDDRVRADPQSLLDDYRVLALVAQALNDKALSQEVAVRQQSLCAAQRSAACSELSQQKP